VIDDIRAPHSLERLQAIHQGLRVFIFGDVQHQRVSFIDLPGEFFLSAEGDQFAVVDDPDPVGELLGFFHVVGGVKDGHALAVELFDRIEDGPA